MVLIDASTRWSYVCLLSTRNVAFVMLLTQRPSKLTMPRMSVEIDVEYLVAHTHTQNGLAESLINRL